MNMEFLNTIMNVEVYLSQGGGLCSLLLQYTPVLVREHLATRNCGLLYNSIQVQEIL